MNNLLIDSSAWVEYFAGSQKGRKIQQLLKGANVMTTGLIATEVAIKAIKDCVDENELMLAMESIAQIVPFDLKLARESAAVYVEQRKKQPKFGLADAHVAAAAKLSEAKIVTCDNDFRGISGVLIV